MNGIVARLQAWIEVALRLADGGEAIVRCLVDTGFEGYIALPASLIARYSLPEARFLAISLADDSLTATALYDAVILWHGEERAVEVMALGDRPLLGTELLGGSELLIQFTDDGEVSIEPL
jgi:clan AA aspartic protease